MRTSPTQRTLAECRKRGGAVAVVEHWNPFAHIRQDLFGFIDLVWIRPDGVLVGIQACAGASHAARRTKTMASPLFPIWLQCGRQMEVWSWAKQGSRGKAKRWTLRTESLKLPEFSIDKP